MSTQHPIMAITGSSGAGTTSVTRTIEQIFRREGIRAAMVEGDAFHRYDRAGMQRAIEEHEQAGNRHFSHFSPEANLLASSRSCSRRTARRDRRVPRVPPRRRTSAAAASRRHVRRLAAIRRGHRPAVLRGSARRGTSTDEIDIAQHADLLVGVVPIINLEWIQKMHRDRTTRGHSHEAIVATILRRMPDYIDHICPQFSRTDVNFQRVPHVDTSNPFIARHIPTARREHARHPVPRPARHRLLLPARDAPRLVHVAAQHDRGARREDGAGDAADLHADDPAADGEPAPHPVRLLRPDEPRRRRSRRLLPHRVARNRAGCTRARPGCGWSRRCGGRPSGCRTSPS